MNRRNDGVCAIWRVLLFAMAIFSVTSCANRYPATYEPDSMLIDAKNPAIAHLYDLYGRYMSTGQFIDNCLDKPILSQSIEAMAQCRFKTDVSIYPSGISAILNKVAKARSASGMAQSGQPDSTSTDKTGSATPLSNKIAAENTISHPASTPLTLSPTSPRRLALVVGNSRYSNLPLLDNPSNDAELIARTLAEVGFELVGGRAMLDLDKASLEESVKAFSKELHQGGRTAMSKASQNGLVALFYYAGHGIQVRGENYLVPIDANPTKEADLDFQLINVNVVLRQMESASTNLNLVILDACRNNPIGGRGLRSGSNGLAEMRAPEGTLIAFATQSGNVAQDGPRGGNSPFAQSLAWGIKQPNLDQFGTFNAVAVHVKKLTNGAQLPWMSNSPIEGQFYFMSP